jgi:O-antigen/teichoic acid export membrane protein
MTDDDRRRDEEDSRAAAGAGIVSVATMVQSLLELLLVAVLTRILDQTTFGLFAFAFMVLVTIRVIGTLGLPESLLYFVPKLGPRVERALGVACSAQLLALSVPIAAALWLAGPWLAGALGAPGTGPLLRYVAILVLAELPAEVLPRFLLAKRAYRASFAVTLAFAAARFCSVAVPAALGFGLDEIFFWFVAVGYGRFVVCLVYFAILDGDLRATGWKHRDLLAFGAPMAMSKIIGRLNRELDKYMIFIIFTPAIYGVYTVGAQEVPFVESVAYSVTSALLPTLVLRFEQRDVDGFLRLWHGSMTKTASLMMPVFVSCFILAEPLMRTAFTPAFEAAAIPFRVYLCLLPLRLCGYGVVVRALGKTWPVMASAVVGLVVNAGLNYPLYLAFGIAGPGVASVLAQLASIVLLLEVTRRGLGVGAGRVFPYRDVGKTFAVAGVAGAPLLLVVAVAPSDAVSLAVGFPLYAVMYLAVARLTGVVGAADLRYLLDLATLKILRRAR